MKKEIWERLASAVKKNLAKSHRLDLDDDNKIARLYRTSRFKILGIEFGPLPSAPYEDKEEILIDGNENKAIVKHLGFDYMRLNNAMKKAFDKVGIGYLQKEFSTEENYRMEYYWKTD